MSSTFEGLEPEEVEALRHEFREVMATDVGTLSYHEYLRWWTRARKLQRYFSKPLIPPDMFKLAYSADRKEKTAK